MKKIFLGLVLSMASLCFAHEDIQTDNRTVFGLTLNESTLKDIQAKFHKDCVLSKQDLKMPTDIQDESFSFYSTKPSCTLHIPHQQASLIVFYKPTFMIDDKTGKLIKMQFHFKIGNRKNDTKDENDDGTVLKEKDMIELLVSAIAGKYNYIPSKFNHQTRFFCNDALTVIVQKHPNIIAFQLSDYFYNQVKINKVCKTLATSVRQLRASF